MRKFIKYCINKAIFYCCQEKSWGSRLITSFPDFMYRIFTISL